MQGFITTTYHLYVATSAIQDFRFGAKLSFPILVILDFLAFIIDVEIETSWPFIV